MADLKKAAKNLEERGFSVRLFATGAEAADYLDGAIDGKTVGFGGSITLRDMGVYERLASHNSVHWHWKESPVSTGEAATAQVYLSSVNGLDEDGTLINIDGNGNRVASMLYGHEKLYLVAGRNKLAATYDEALWRARNIAAPKNAQRLDRKTPCAVKGDKCYDCKSPERICRGLAVLWRPMSGMETEVVLIDEDLGY
ncbi:lactate utilization protein [Oscillibacter sp. GMB15532]|uniref:lactate utilization protein n=1 Tax=Oscillibacter sp. GMB15532 TaxID=3230022 RepID=UPI0034DF7918